MYRKILFLFIMSLFASKAKAELDEMKAVLLQGISGKEYIVLLDEQPVVTFCDDRLVVTTRKNIVSFEASQITKFIYLNEENTTQINKVNQSCPIFSFKGKHLNLTNLIPLTNVYVYTINGLLVSFATTDDSGNVSLAVPEQRGVIYVIKTSTINFKVRKP